MLQTLSQAVLDYFSGPLGKLELVATVLLMTNVYLLGRQRLSNYWFGFAGVILFGFLFRESRLYSDMLLQWVFYAPLQVIGYLLWKYGRTLGEAEGSGHPDSMRVVILTPGYWPAIGLIVIASTWALGAYMANNTDASFPYADALTTTMSIAASILMLKKILENWVLWIAVDLVAVPVYFLKGLYVTAGLYVVFLALAAVGLVRWWQDYQRHRSAVTGHAG